MIVSQTTETSGPLASGWTFDTDTNLWHTPWGRTFPRTAFPQWDVWLPQPAAPTPKIPITPLSDCIAIARARAPVGEISLEALLVNEAEQRFHGNATALENAIKGIGTSEWKGGTTSTLAEFLVIPAGGQEESVAAALIAAGFPIYHVDPPQGTPSEYHHPAYVLHAIGLYDDIETVSCLSPYPGYMIVKRLV